MAIPHAAPGEAIEVCPREATGPGARTTTLVKTARLEVLRLALPAGKEVPPHAAPGEITVHCLAGRVAFTALGRTEDLAAGQMLYLPARTEHAVRGVEDAAVLVTILL